MNSKLEEEVAQLRCNNKSVKYISRKLSLGRDDIERIITQWIINTDHYIEKAVSGHKVQRNPEAFSVLDAIKSTANIVPLHGEVLDYVSLHRSDHHDRLMDCIRFRILRSMVGTV